MSSKKHHNCEEILARAKSFLGVTTNKDLARLLGVKENSVSTWKKRGTLDIGKILLKCEGIDQNWLLTGQGNPSQNPITNSKIEEVEMLKDELIAQMKKHQILFDKHAAVLEENAALREKLASAERRPLTKKKLG